MSLRYSILRGRFQPFNKLHYDCIKAYYQEYVASQTPNDWPWLTLCIIRDYETVLSASSLLRRHTSSGEYLRHLSFFNPFPIAYCKYFIREGLQHFCTVEMEQGTEDNQFLIGFRNFIANRVMIQAVPLKFGEVLESLEHGHDFIPNSIMRLVDEGTEDTAPNEAVERLLKLFSIIVHETLRFPVANEFDWFLPVLDKEDVLDYDSILEKGYQPERIQVMYHSDMSTYYDSQELDPYFTPELKDLRRIGPLSHYGVFIYYVYLIIAGNKITENKNVAEELRRVESFIRPLVSERCFSQYKAEIDWIKSKYLVSDQGMTMEERDLLNNPNKFAELSQAYLKIAGLDDLKRLRDEQVQILGHTWNDLTLEQCWELSVLERAKSKYERWKVLPHEANKTNNRFLRVEEGLLAIITRRAKEPRAQVTVEFKNIVDIIVSASAPAEVEDSTVAKLEALINWRE